MHFLLHSTGSDPYEEPSSHSLTWSLTGYIPSGRCPARSRRIPHSWRGKERTQGLGGHRRKGSEKFGRSGPRGEKGKKRGQEKRSWEGGEAGRHLNGKRRAGRSRFFKVSQFISKKKVISNNNHYTVLPRWNSTRPWHSWGKITWVWYEQEQWFGEAVAWQEVKRSVPTWICLNIWIYERTLLIVR